MDDDLVYIRNRLDDIADKVSGFKVYINQCNEERDKLFKNDRSLIKDVTDLKSQAIGKNKTFDVAIRILTLLVGVGVLISGIIFWIIRLTK